MKILNRLALILVFLTAGTLGADTTPGKLTGGEKYTLPNWFKNSFLEINVDVEEARENDRHVMVFLHLDECPYCVRVINENFISGENRDYLENSFDSIGINIMGDLEVSWIDGNAYTEQQLARQLKVVGTPTMVFLDLAGNKVLQLNGYRDPVTIHRALDYVSGQHYASQSFDSYLVSLDRSVVYEFRTHPQLELTTNLKEWDGPVAVLFEDQYCMECDRFHNTTLAHAKVQEALGPYLFVRLDSEATYPIVTPGGEVTTPKQWAKDLGLSYRPAVVLFNEHREIHRADGILYHQHFTEALLYSAGLYTEYDSIRAFKADYREEMMSRGEDVDFSE